MNRDGQKIVCTEGLGDRSWLLCCKEEMISHMHMVSFSTNRSYLGGKLVQTANSAAVQLKPPRGLRLVLAAIAQYYVRWKVFHLKYH